MMARDIAHDIRTKVGTNEVNDKIRSLGFD